MTDPADSPIQTYWVIPGKLLAGEYPGARLPYDPWLARKLGYLLAQKVSYFVDLTEQGELAPYDEALWLEAGRLGRPVEYQRFPIHDFSVPSQARMSELLDKIDVALQAGKVIYLHCWGGIGRTGTVVGCFLVRQGLTGKQALARLAELRAGLSDAWRRSPESNEQRQMVLEWNRSK